MLLGTCAEHSGGLVKDGTTGLDKVLLTNTVYPLVETGSAVLKPKYKLVGKRSPPFAVRVVAADVLAPVTFDPDARCTPGGESSLVRESLQKSEYRGVSDDEDGDSGEGFLVEVGFGDGVMEEVIEDFGLGLRFLGRCESDECSETRIGLRALTEETASWIEELLEQRCFSDTQCREALERGLGDLPMAKRPALKGKGRAVLLGLYGLGGFQGVSRASEANPEVTRYLNGFVKACCPEHVWTSLYVSKNTSMPIHRDLGNAKGFDVGVRALGEFVGGGLWVEGESNVGSVCKVVGSGVKRFGTVYDIRSQAKVFSGERWHVSEDWEGEVRWIVSAFTPRKVEATTSDEWECLKGLGFPVAEVQAKLESIRLLKTCHVEALGSDAVPGEHSEWEIGLPLPVVDSAVCDGFVGCHKSTARLCRMLTDELCDAIVNVESVPALAMQLRCAEQKREWLEGCLLSVAAPEGVGVRALHAEIPLNTESAPQDQFLQTRAVGLAEARRELDKWKDPAREEVVSLETTNRAVDRVTVADVDKWAAEGLQVVQLPGKVVLTRKSGTGKRRCRAVCCGNYLPAEKLGLTREDLYASGAESLSVKVALTFAAGHPSWTGVTIDVKSAFLYVPIRSGSQESEERIVVKPPNFLVELGILGRNDRWWIRKALYGLPTSPRDWGRYRDQEFRQFRLRWNDVDYQLVQTRSDDALWLACRVTEGGCGETEGILVVYVDDLAFLGPEGLCRAFILAVQTSWKTSEPEWLNASPVTFCGMELSRHPAGFRMCQAAYVQELLGRYGIESSSMVPISKWVEPEVVDSPSPEDVRDAQAITGALLWLSTRTRPDLAYAVSRCGQQATKNPNLSVSLGKQALAYLRSTVDFGIDVPFQVGSFFSDHGLLSLPRTERVIELYTDASHSPSGDRSMQAIFILWKGVPVAWEATRQAFTTLSSAEAELVAMMHGVQLSEAVHPLIEELIENDTVVSLLGDNEAALRSFQSTPSGWRNRHLRMRALAGRERIDANLLKVSHIPGEVQLADIGTKPL